MRTAWVVGLVLLVGSAACANDDDSGSVDETGRAVEGANAPEGGADGGSEEAGGGEDLGALPTGDPIQAGRSIIATGEVTLEVEDVRNGARRVTDVASAAGGFLAQQEASPADGVTTLTVRVPTDRFQAVMGELESIGEVLGQRVDTEDVTEQVVDLESRIASARTSVGRVRNLLEESGDVVQLATVEGELARREADLEALLGRQRVLDDQVALATIHVDLREPAAVAEDEDDDALPGFLGGLRSGWDGFVTSASVVVTGVGYALPFLVLAGAVAVGWSQLRRLRDRRQPSAG